MFLAPIGFVIKKISKEKEYATIMMVAMTMASCICRSTTRKNLYSSSTSFNLDLQAKSLEQAKTVSFR